MPKFVTRWIKKTSATGKLRSTENVRVRRQDGPKQELLCDGCEQRLSRHEKWFAEEVFVPHMDGTARQPSMASGSLLPFVVGLAWRAGAVDGDRLASRYPRHARSIRRARSSWRKHLLDGATPSGNHYIFPLPDVIYTTDESDRVNWYLNCSVDVTALLIAHRPFVWWKIPGFAGLSSLGGHPLPAAGPYRVQPDGLGERVWTGHEPDVVAQLVLSRAGRAAARLSDIPASHWDTIERDYRGAGDDWWNSAAASAAEIDYLNAQPPDTEGPS